MKLLRDIIFILSVLLLTSVSNEAKALASFSFQQIRQQVKTGQEANPTAKGEEKKDELKEKIQYGAIDSTVTDKKTGIVYLYGKAKVIYNDFQLDAAYIKYDSKNEIIFASGLKNKEGRYVGKPIFKMGDEASSSADSLTYNTKTGRGVVHGVHTEQEGGFFSGGRLKLQPENEAHLKGTTFSTCNLPHPHFGIFITKGIATETQIITGPVYLKIEDIPMPLGLPFGFFPKPNKKSSGFILPSPVQDATRGFGLLGAGYYYAFNDYADARVMSNVYSNGSYDLSVNSAYLKRYKYNGDFGLTFSSHRNGLEGTDEYKPQTAFNIRWQHSQNANARPGTTFSASVNAGTSNFNKLSLADGTRDISQVVSNTMNSQITYGKIFGNGLFNFNAALSHYQETQTKAVSLVLPDIGLNMSTISPFDSKNRVDKQKWYQKLTMGYSFSAKNSVTTTEDLLFQKDGLKRFQNGFQHRINTSLPFTIADYFIFNTTANYNERWYLQTINKRLIRLANNTDTTLIDTVGGFKRAGEYDIAINMTTKIYKRKQFKNFGNIKGISHIITPTIGFSYKPDFSASKYGYYKDLKYYTDDIRPGYSRPVDGMPIKDVNGRNMVYSIFEQGVYGGPSSGEQANLNFSVGNSVELKIKSKKDTTNGGEKKIAIIQGLSFSGSYNFMAPTKKLSMISFSGQSQLTDKIGINFSGAFSPYLVEDVEVTSGPDGNQTTTLFTQEANKYVWSEGKLPRLTSFGTSFNYSFNPEAFKSRNKNMDQLRNQPGNQGRTPEQIAELEAISRDPNAFVDFNIPWNFTFSYTMNYSRPLRKGQVTHGLDFNGDLNLTPKWKIQFRSGWDFMAKTFGPTSFQIYRDLHCWDLSASWLPFGTLASYSVTIKVKASILQDLKLSKRQGYYTKYN